MNHQSEPRRLAKRLPPKKVEPLVYGDLQFTVSRGGAVGEVQAHNVSNPENPCLIWKKTLYTVHYHPTLEKDVQDVFIRSLKIEDGVLVVENEHNEMYKLDPQTGDSVQSS
jgi:hypothetical protein